MAATHILSGRMTLTARGASETLVRAGQYAPGCRFMAAVESSVSVKQVMLKGVGDSIDAANGSGTQ